MMHESSKDGNQNKQEDVGLEKSVPGPPLVLQRERERERERERVRERETEREK